MKLIFILLMIVGFSLLGGFIWMICLGALSHIFHEPRLAIGFWSSVIVAFIANALIGSRTKN